MRLIVNADDFGVSRAVNLGIIDCFKRGIVTSATIMMNMPQAEDAVMLAKENGLPVGLHLVMTSGFPVSEEVPSLVGEDGRFMKRKEQLKGYSLKDVEKEFRSQIEKALMLGLVPTHLDSHHHVHLEPGISDIVGDLAKELMIPVRVHTKDHVPEGLKGIPSPDRMIASFHGDNLTPADLEKAIEAASKYETAELMCHPGYLDTFVMHNSSYNRERAKELDVLVSSEAREIIERYKVELISFKDL
ncbi:carbohydrate deacetylase [Youngiibacter multivorans]|uniref:Glycoside hydrolase/deacetylase ChbG (UPF0249 family) n=1 Tax=Youngiibacter multivorans TaxID=937251 RepID=A0ABS4G892_9CLOT|nr:carbohydrate deacetylase [Youngiibacter multivorans]MBP1920787.1 putative glycoside hydrolase/deacetylase ChbG (UPF0249 family) [Youngiibacter multivorans]